MRQAYDYWQDQPGYYLLDYQANPAASKYWLSLYLGRPSSTPVLLTKVLLPVDTMQALCRLVAKPPSDLPWDRTPDFVKLRQRVTLKSILVASVLRWKLTRKTHSCERIFPDILPIVFMIFTLSGRNPHKSPSLRCNLHRRLEWLSYVQTMSLY